jgi:hypothetical protein
MKKVYVIVMLGTFVFAACRKADTSGPVSCGKEQFTPDNTEVDEATVNASFMNSDEDFCKRNSRLSIKTLFELQLARLATIKYRNFDNAVRDQYEDIKVVMPNMGYHFMKKAIVDTVFDIAHPEILVYNKNKYGKFELVAVEYAQPISDVEPKGFTGNADHWDHNTGFGLWLLHAWVWQFNPDGVFNPTNPLVHVRQ